MILWLIDGVLVAIITWLGWKSVSDTDLFRAAIHFVAMGLLVALAWVRLRAPDVALAEAAVGAGLTGALVLSAVAALPRDERGRPISTASSARRRPAAHAFRALLSCALFVLVASALLAMPSSPVGLTAAALAELASSGVTNPVTAVLLNYRGYDTLLEVAVLLLVVIAVWSVRRAYGVVPGWLDDRPPLMTLVRAVVPALVLASGYLLWRGGFAPGGAFQGGALLGGACVLLMVTGLADRSFADRLALRAGLVLGTLVFVAVAALAMLSSGNLLEYPAGSAKYWILLIEAAAMSSIGLTLGALYFGGRPPAAARTDAIAEAGHGSR